MGARRLQTKFQLQSRKEKGECMPLLEAEADVSKFFAVWRRSFEVNFRIYRGETLSIIGPNGAGKSTLFNVMTGFQTRGSGRESDSRVRIFHRVPPHRIIRRGMARIFRSPRLFPP